MKKFNLVFLFLGFTIIINFVGINDVFSVTSYNSCNTISASGDYVLTTNLNVTLTSYNSCFDFSNSNLNNVVFDCQNHYIKSTGGGVGFYLSNNNNITLKNCIFINMIEGVEVDNSINEIFNNLTFINYSTSNYALYLYRTGNSIINNLTFINITNSGGVGFELDNNNKINSNKISNIKFINIAGTGLQILGSSSSKPNNNTFTNFTFINVSSSGNAFYGKNFANNSFFNFNFYNSSGALNYFLYIQNNSFVNFNFKNSSNTGFYLQGTTTTNLNNSLLNFTSYSYNTLFNFVSANMNTIENIYSNNTIYPIVLTSSNKNSFFNLSLYNTSSSGQAIQLSKSSNNSFSNFDIYNTSNGIYIAQTSGTSQNNSFKNGKVIFVPMLSAISLSGPSTLYNEFSNLNISDAANCLDLNNIQNNTFNTVNCYNSVVGIDIYSNSNYNKFISSIINSTSSYEIHFDGSSNNNTFYLNHFTGSNKVLSDNWATTKNNFSEYISGIGTIGNYWSNFTCLSSVNHNGVYICTNPADYILNNINNIDYAPLIMKTSSSSSSNSIKDIFPLSSFHSMILSLVIVIGFLIR